MVIDKLIYVFLFFIFSNLAYSKGVRNIEVNKVGGVYEGHSITEKKGCKLFRPTKEQVINYFNKAKELKYGGSIEHQYYSPCIATGIVTFKDGTTGKWTIQSSGFGYGTFNNEAMNFFYKDNEWNDPFKCSYAMGDESEPGC